MARDPQYVSLAVLDPVPRRLVWSHLGRDEGESSPPQCSSCGVAAWGLGKWPVSGGDSKSALRGT